jgi:SAM-dependent methyltransferase
MSANASVKPDASPLPRENAGAALPYDFFAPLYDHFFGPHAAHATWLALDNLLLSSLPEGARVLDLCCGTGQLTAELARRGFCVTGVDNSAGMLGFARQRAPEAEFVEADIREWLAPRQFHAVVSAYNSLTHMLSADDLLRVFRNVRAGLLQGGIFVFDIYGESAYPARWQGNFSEVTSDKVCLVRASYDPSTRTGQNLITSFQMERGAGNNVWRRHDVKLVTRCYGDQEIAALLEAAGFRHIEHWEGKHGLGIVEASGRVFWRSRRE